MTVIPQMSLSGNIGFDDSKASNTKASKPFWVASELYTFEKMDYRLTSPSLSYFLNLFDRNTFAHDTKLMQIKLFLQKAMASTRKI